MSLFLPAACRRIALAAASVCLAFAAAGAARADIYADVQRLAESGQTAQALQRADAHLAEHPRDAQMRFVKAGVLSAGGDARQAEELLRQLTIDHPELPEPWNNLAVLHARRGELDKAEEALQAALRINPAYATALENLGDVRVRQAAAAYQRAQSLDGRNERLAPKLTALRVALPDAAAGAAAPPERAASQ